VEQELATVECSMTIAHAAMNRQYQRRPRALPSASQIARLIQIALEFGRLAVGAFRPDPEKEQVDQAQGQFALERCYGQALPDDAAPVLVTPITNAPTRPNSVRQSAGRIRLNISITSNANVNLTTSTIQRTFQESQCD
jgi:hypothetical protein